MSQDIQLCTTCVRVLYTGIDHARAQAKAKPTKARARLYIFSPPTYSSTDDSITREDV